MNAIAAAAANNPKRTRALLAIFYRRVDVVGLEHVPARGPLLVAGNHQNGLVDPMLLIATMPRTLRPLAKSGLFRHPLIAPFLALARALPVYRRQDADGDASIASRCRARARPATAAARHDRRRRRLPAIRRRPAAFVQGHRPDRLQRDEVPAHPRPSNPA